MYQTLVKHRDEKLLEVTAVRNNLNTDIKSPMSTYYADDFTVIHYDEQKLLGTMTYLAHRQKSGAILKEFKTCDETVGGKPLSDVINKHLVSVVSYTISQNTSRPPTP